MKKRMLEILGYILLVILCLIGWLIIPLIGALQGIGV